MPRNSSTERTLPAAASRMAIAFDVVQPFASIGPQADLCMVRVTVERFPRREP